MSEPKTITIPELSLVLLIGASSAGKSTLAYRGRATVVYGHTPVPEPEWLNHTINIDTGCVFGGKLTALRYPEKELTFVPAQRVYSEPGCPFLGPEPGSPQLTAQQSHDDLLNIADYLQKLMIHTRLMGHVVVREENAAAALEVMTPLCSCSTVAYLSAAYNVA